MRNTSRKLFCYPVVTTTFIFFIFLSSSSFGQINKGNWLIGGNASYTTHKYKFVSDPSNLKYRTFQVTGDVGYFFISKLATGIRLTYLHENETGLASDSSYFNQTTRDLEIGPFVRYYFLPVGNKYNLLVDADYSFGRRKDKNVGGYSKERSDSYTFAAGPVWFINPKTALELTLSYEHQRNYFMISYTKVNLGLQIHLGKLATIQNQK